VVTVRLPDGVQIEPGDGPTVVADATSPPDGSDPAICSHAHGDHLYTAVPKTLCCSATTAALAAHRRKRVDEATPTGHPAIDLRPAGHIAGSRAALIESRSRRILYTGDVSIRDRWYLDGFDPVPADVLIVESTYGRPAYRFPDQSAVEARVLEWLNGTLDQVALCVGYSLGKAQKLQRLVAASDRNRCIVPEVVAGSNNVIERTMDVSFDHVTYRDGLAIAPGDAIVLSRGSLRTDWAARLRASTSTVTAGFSGWAVDRSYRYRTGDDETFVLSDHCDFDELVSLVHAVDPEQVYTLHGFADEFAMTLTSEYGYPAQSLKRGQRSLDEF